MAQPRKPKTPTPSAPNKAFVRKDQKAWKRAGWTSVPNSILHDTDLPPTEAWAWSWMASHTETFEVSADKLWKANDHVSKQVAYDLMHNLEVRGLLRRVHEASDQGVPYIVYDLQPVPCPEDQRTAKPRKPKPKKKPPKGAFDWKSSQSKMDSRPGGNPGMTRGNADTATVPTIRSSGGSLPPGSLPPGRESPIRKKRPTEKTNKPTVRLSTTWRLPMLASRAMLVGWTNRTPSQLRQTRLTPRVLDSCGPCRLALGTRSLDTPSQSGLTLSAPRSAAAWTKRS